MNVLIVDDHPTNLKLLQTLLEAEGQTVHTATNGIEALTCLEGPPVDAIISDILMPKMDGYRLCYEVRRSERLRDIRFIFYTATYTSAGDERLCFDLGGDRYLRKPATPEKILAALHEVMRLPHGSRPRIAHPSENDVLKEYSERLVDKLEEKNVDLLAALGRQRDSDLQFRQIAENIPEVFFLTDVESGRTLYISSAYERIWGRSRESLYANPDSWIEAIHPDDRAAAYGNYKDGMMSGESRHEYRVVRLDESVRHVAVRRFPVRDATGKIVRIAGLAADITEKRLAALELRESERRFSEMLRNMKLLAVMLNDQGRITYCNDFLLHLTGWQAAEVLGKDWFELFIPPELDLSQLFADVLADRPHAWNHENEILTRSGERRLVRWTNTVLRSGAGEAVGTASIGEDITKRRRAEGIAVAANAKVESTNEMLRQEIGQRLAAEQALLEVNIGLEGKVAARTAELQAAKERAEAADQLKSQFLANMSHELRTPLNAIIGFTGTLLMKLPGAINAVQEEQLTIVQTSARHLLSLINDLLDLAKIESGKMQLRLEPVACQVLLKEIVATLRPMAEKKGLSLALLAPNGEIRVTTDARALKQIVLNLCNNAIKFTDAGSVALELKQVSEKGPLEISVTDTGIGIRPEDRDRLFQVFSQMDSTLREGTGLGLHLSGKLAQLIGGRIEFSSEYGKGSRFWLTLPVE